MKVISTKPIARCFDDELGSEYQVVYFDGYSFGDRLLEGVGFKAELTPEGFLEVSTAPGSVKYMENLNEVKWLRSALDFAENTDTFNVSEDGRGEDVGYKDM